MNNDQKIVAIGAVSGIALMLVGVWFLTQALSAPMIIDGIAARLAYALGANVFAIIPFFVMIATVGNARFFSTAIDPTRHMENKATEINGNVAENTLQQNFIFLVASLALSTLVTLQYLQIVWAAAVMFVISRCVFWIGYRIHPLYRAPGFAATAYLNLFMLLYVLYQLVF